MKEDLDEDLLEQLYWEFDSRRAKKELSERDIFKQTMRHFARHEVKKFLEGNYALRNMLVDHC